MAGVASNTQVGSKVPLDTVILDGAGSQITSFGGSGGTSHTDDAAFTIGSASSITPLGALADDTTPDSVDEGDVGVPRMTLSRILLTRLVGATDGNRADIDASGHLQVDIAADSVGIGGGTEYTEDAAAAANPVGTALILVREDARAGSLTTADGDNVAARGNNFGELYVKHTDSIAVTNAGLTELAAAIDTELQVDIVAALPAGTNAIGKLAANSGVDIGDVDVLSVIPGTGATNLGKAIDTATGATDTGVLALTTRDDALSALTPIEGDNVALRVDANGALWTHDDVLEAAIAGSELQVDVVAALPAGTNAIGKLAANSGIDIGDVDILSIAAGDNNIGNVDVVTLPALVAGTANIGDVDVLTLPGIVGTIADDATTPGAPVMIGGTAVETDGTDPGSVSAEDDVARVRTDRNRRLLVNDRHPNSWSLFEDHTTAQTNNQLKAAPGAGLSLYITDIIFSNGATAGSIKLVEDESGTPVQLTQTVYMAINGGAVIPLKTPIRMTANKTLGFTSATVTTHSIEVHGYIAP